MKQLEINEEQKVKLLEMCKVLFPEYKYWNLHDGSCDLCTENTLDFAKEEKPRWNSWNRIHWFEFCMTHLVDKIYYPDGNGKRDTRDEVEHFMFQSFLYKIEDAIDDTIHPVDYLYTEFKKL